MEQQAKECAIKEEGKGQRLKTRVVGVWQDKERIMWQSKERNLGRKERKQHLCLLDTLAIEV